MSFQTLDCLIEDIIKIHKDIAELWSSSISYRQINFAKKLVVDVMDISRCPDYLEYIFKYRSFLYEKIVAYGLKLGQNGYEFRVKTQNSIESKLNTYMQKKGVDGSPLEGEIPLKKCLNDLFGIRYIFNDNTYNLEEIVNHLKSTYPKSMYPQLKIGDASKNGYNGVHIYFQRDNYTFPWELQIWNREDVENNKASHSIYKQEYTEWERESEKEVK